MTFKVMTFTAAEKGSIKSTKTSNSKIILQFEQMIGLTKQMLYESLGNAHLVITELEEIVLDIEINLNNRPLSCVDNYIELPILTPNFSIYGHSTRK